MKWCKPSFKTLRYEWLKRRVYAWTFYPKGFSSISPFVESSGGMRCMHRNFSSDGEAECQAVMDGGFFVARKLHLQKRGHLVFRRRIKV